MMHYSRNESHLVTLGLFDVRANAPGVEFGERDAFDVKFESRSIQCFIVGPTVNVALPHDCFNN